MDGFLLSDAELHGLVDGQIEMHQRTDILRRAAASAADRQRIGSLQSQCDLIRAAFQGIDHEPLPSSLDLRAPARLHAVAPQCAAVTRAATILDDAPPIVVAKPWRSRRALPLLAALVATGGLAATWLAGGFSLAFPEAASPDEVLARRVADGTAAGPTASPSSASRPSPLPTETIPALAPLGFALTGAELQAGEPASMVFRYRNAAAEQITLGVARSAAPSNIEEARRAAPVGTTLVWHAGTRTYALAGTLRPERLHALFPAVRDLSLDE